MATDYTTLITSEHRNKPRFAALVGLLAGAFGQVTDHLAAQPQEFDLDSAAGAQLDVLGLWIGVSRRQLIPITGVFLTWNDAALGWNFAAWKGPYAETDGLVILSDMEYRAVLRAKVAANYWTGSNEESAFMSHDVLSAEGIGVHGADNLDMSMTVYASGALTAVILALIKRGMLPPKPAGVRVNGYFRSSVVGTAIFALDLDIPYLFGGLDIASFATTF